MTEATSKSTFGMDAPDLIRRAKGSEAAAWAEIYASHSEFIYRYVRARVFDETEAEDLTAGVFLAALQGISSYRDRSRPLRAWLYRIARNTVADHQRKIVGRRSVAERLLPGKWGRQDQPLSLKPIDEAGTRRDDPAEGVERLDLHRAIGELPDFQREVVVLRHFVGLSTPEIAAAIGKKPAAVYSLEARALVSLRGKLADLEETSATTDENRSLRAINKQMELE